MQGVTDDPRFGRPPQSPPQGHVTPAPFVQPSQPQEPPGANWSSPPPQGNAQPYFVPVQVVTQRNPMWRRVLIGAAIGGGVYFVFGLIMIGLAKESEPELFERPGTPSSGDIFFILLAGAALWGAIPGGLIGLIVHWVKRRKARAHGPGVPQANQGLPPNQPVPPGFGVQMPPGSQTAATVRPPYGGGPQQQGPQQQGPPMQGRPPQGPIVPGPPMPGGVNRGPSNPIPSNPIPPGQRPPGPRQ